MKQSHAVVFCVTVAAMVLVSPLWATWSIVAVDSTTGEVGSAGASCTGFVAGIVGLAPGRGVIVAQAASNARARRRGVEMLTAGASPRAVLAAVTDSTFDRGWREQQYGIAALGFERDPVAFTGSATAEWRGDVQGFGVSVQGNILTDSTVLGATFAAFAEQPGTQRSLAERLLAALEAGAAAGGDRRCGAQTALSAYLVVARPSDAADRPSVMVIVPGQRRGGANPVAIVRQRFEQGRSR